MFTFHWSELLVIVIGGLILFLGLALLMLRRRNEILQDFLTPAEPNLEEDFFRVRESKVKKPPAEETGEEKPAEQTAEVVKEGNAQWGVAGIDNLVDSRNTEL